MIFSSNRNRNRLHEPCNRPMSDLIMAIHVIMYITWVSGDGTLIASHIFSLQILAFPIVTMTFPDKTHIGISSFLVTPDLSMICLNLNLVVYVIIL